MKKEVPKVRKKKERRKNRKESEKEEESIGRISLSLK
jgi:hypothetical protein